MIKGMEIKILLFVNIVSFLPFKKELIFTSSKLHVGRRAGTLNQHHVLLNPE